jgi:hypothetical protein
MPARAHCPRRAHVYSKKPHTRRQLQQLGAELGKLARIFIAVGRIAS